MSFRYGIQYAGTLPTSPETTASGQAVPYYSGIGSSVSERDPQQLQRDIYALDTLLQADLPKDRRADFEVLVPKLKLGLMRQMWREEWGNFESFKTWVLETGAAGAPPDGLQKAAAYYHGKETHS